MKFHDCVPWDYPAAFTFLDSVNLNSRNIFWFWQIFLYNFCANLYPSNLSVLSFWNFYQSDVKTLCLIFQFYSGFLIIFIGLFYIGEYVLHFIFQISYWTFTFSYHAINIPVSFLLFTAPFLTVSCSCLWIQFSSFQSTVLVEHQPCAGHEHWWQTNEQDRLPALIELTIQLGVTESKWLIDRWYQEVLELFFKKI